MEGVTYLQADVQDDSQIAASFDKMMKLTDGRMSGVSVSLIEPGDFSTGFTATRKRVNVEMASDAYPSYARSLASIENDENNGLKPDYLASQICRIVDYRAQYPNLSIHVRTVFSSTRLSKRPSFHSTAG